MKKKQLYIKFLLHLICCCSIYLNAQQFRTIETQAGLGDISNNNGIAIADYDLDNDLDIFIVGEKIFNIDDPKTWSRLLKNNNDGSFEDITVEAGFAEGFNHDIAFQGAFDLGE